MDSQFFDYSALVPLDRTTGAIASITTEHAMIHAGRSFELTGTFAANGTNAAAIQFSPPVDTAASHTVDMTNANADLTYTAVAKGTDGNSINITHIDPDAASATLSVSVLNKQIIVSLATNGAKAITTTAAQVVAAIAANADSSALVTCSAEGTGAGVVNAAALFNLSGGKDEVEIHLKQIDLTAAADIVTVSIYEGASFTGTAATFTPINNNRNSARTSIAAITGTLAATVTTTGATKLRQITARGSATGANVRNSSVSPQEEIEFSAGKVYIIAFVPTGATAIDYAVRWYEMPSNGE